MCRLPGDDERRQVEHDAHPDPGADVRRAGGEEAELRMEGVGNDLLDLLVHPLDLLPDALQVEAAVHALDPQVVLLVDHQADLLAAIDRHAPRALGLGELAADELPLDEELAVDFLQPADVDVLELPAHRRGGNPLVQEPLDVGPVLLGGSADERVVGHVAGQPDAAAHDDVRFRPGAAQPFAHGLGQ